MAALAIRKVLLGEKAQKAIDMYARNTNLTHGQVHTMIVVSFMKRGNPAHIPFDNFQQINMMLPDSLYKEFKEWSKAHGRVTSKMFAAACDYWIIHTKHKEV